MTELFNRRGGSTEDELDFGLPPGERYEPPDDDEVFDLHRPHVMTVLGPVEPGLLGVTLPHEHLLADPPAYRGVEPDYAIPDRDAALADLEEYHFAGGGAIVDATPPDNGRDLKGLAWVAGMMPVHIVATAGFHKEQHSRDHLTNVSEEMIVEDLVRELEVGVGEPPTRPGLLKSGSGPDEVTEIDEKGLRAVARAHHRTGVPITLHTEPGPSTSRQVAILDEEGVDPNRVILNHLDRRYDDDAFLVWILDRGFFVSFDQLGKPHHGPDDAKASSLATLISAGYADQLLLSHDLARRSLRKAYGGSVGWTYILDRFTLLLLDLGVDAMTVRTLLIDNPGRALTVIRPPR